MPRSSESRFFFVINVYSEATTVSTCRLHMLRLANSRNTLGFGIQFDKHRIDVHSVDLCTRTVVILRNCKIWYVWLVFYALLDVFLLVLMRIDVLVRLTATEIRFK